MRPKRYPFSGAKKESKLRRYRSMLKKSDELDFEKEVVWGGASTYL